MSKKNTGTQRHYYKNLLSIGIPIVIGQLGTIILGFADTIMIGHHSTEELAAAGLVNNIYTLVFVMYMGFTYGLTPIIGRLYGEERIDSIGQKVRNSLFANMLTGTLLSLALVVLYLNLSHIGQPEELLALIRPYFIVNLVSVLFMGIFYTMKQFLDGVAETRVAMWVMIAGNVVNIFGNWLLIYGVSHDGFISLGIQAAPAVIHRGNGNFVCRGIIEKTPVSVVPIPISDQRIYNEYIPKMLLQQCGRECCLILHGPHNVRQFCTIPAVTGIDHRVFQRGKVL